METITGGQLVAEALIEKHVKYIFTLSGGHITPIYQYLENTEITLFDTRHEQAAVFMAEAWGKMTRKHLPIRERHSLSNVDKRLCLHGKVRDWDEKRSGE